MTPSDFGDRYDRRLAATFREMRKAIENLGTDDPDKIAAILVKRWNILTPVPGGGPGTGAPVGRQIRPGSYVRYAPPAIVSVAAVRSVPGHTSPVGHDPGAVDTTEHGAARGGNYEDG